MAAWEEFQIEPKDFIDRGGLWIVPILFRGRGRGSGVEVELPFFHAFVIRNGLIAWIGAYESEEQALEGARAAAQ